MTEAECKDMAENGHLLTAYNEDSDETDNACYNIAAGTVLPWYGTISGSAKGDYPKYCIVFDDGGTCKVAFNPAGRDDYAFSVGQTSWPNSCYLNRNCIECGTIYPSSGCSFNRYQYSRGHYCCRSCTTNNANKIRQFCQQQTIYINRMNDNQRDCSVAYKDTVHSTTDPRYYTPEGRCVRSIRRLPKIKHCV